MLDDFFVRAIVAGIGLACVVGPLGCFIVWRRLAYFGDTLAHASLLGVAMALAFEVNITVSVFVVCAVISMALLGLRRRAPLSSDALLGLLAHSTLALGLVALAFMSWVRVDLMGFLFGDILAVSHLDLAVIYIGGGMVLAVLALVWRDLFAATVNRELAEAEGIDPDRVEVVFILMMATVIAISMKIIGVLLITALLIIPAATARHLSRGPEAMAVISVFTGIVAVVGGLFGSLEWDTPSGPSIVVAAALLFVVAMIGTGLRRAAGRGQVA